MAQGYEGTLRDWIIEGRRAGASSTTIDMGRQETEYDKTRGKQFAERANTIEADANAARGTLSTLSAMEREMSDPNFYSGPWAERVRGAKRVAAALGLDPEAVGSMEAFNTLASRAVLESMGGSLGAGFSNADRDFVMGQVANLDNSPEGNRRIIEFQRKINERKVQIAELAREYARENGGRLDAGFDERLAEWSEANPLFPQEETESIDDVLGRY